MQIVIKIVFLCERRTGGVQKQGKYSKNLTGLWGGVWCEAFSDREWGEKCQWVQYEGVRWLYVVFSIQYSVCWPADPSFLVGLAVSAGSQAVSSGRRGVLVRLSPSRPCTWQSALLCTRCLGSQGIPAVPGQTSSQPTGWAGLGLILAANWSSIQRWHNWSC